MMCSPLYARSSRTSLADRVMDAFDPLVMFHTTKDPLPKGWRLVMLPAPPVCSCATPSTNKGLEGSGCADAAMELSNGVWSEAVYCGE